MYQNILVPLDGSKLAECVLPHVQALVRGCQASRVIFVQVVEHFRHPPGGHLALPDEQVREIASRHRAEAQAYLKNVTSAGSYGSARAESVVLDGYVAETGVVAETLADYAAHNNVDLIVMATHGRSGVSRWVWGSVADRLLRSACVPVLLVRAPGCVPGI